LFILHGGAADPEAMSEKMVRNDFVTLADVRRIEKAIEAEAIRFHQNDGLSIREWVQLLARKGTLLGYKSRTCEIPLGSGLAADTFFLAIQSDWQRSQFRNRGSHLLCIDGTHNITMYENLILTTLIVRDE
ncbi:hypothetical protein H0H92_005889, partial [Tricholoma furcatifolium]